MNWRDTGQIDRHFTPTTVTDGVSGKTPYLQNCTHLTKLVTDCASFVNLQ